MSIDLDDPNPVLAMNNETNNMREKESEKRTKAQNERNKTAKELRARNKSTTNLKTIKQVSVKRTIVFCFRYPCIYALTLAHSSN